LRPRAAQRVQRALQESLGNEGIEPREHDGETSPHSVEIARLAGWNVLGHAVDRYNYFSR
jgi:hypothetical protein